MKLKNYIRAEFEYFGKSSWRLYDKKGQSVDIYEYYTTEANFQSYSYNTRLTYAICTSQFFDYLYEMDTFNTNNKFIYVLSVIQNFPRAYLYGMKLSFKEFIATKAKPNQRLSTEREKASQFVEANLKAAVNALNWKSRDVSTLNVAISSVNRLLKLSIVLFQENIEEMNQHGIIFDGTIENFMKALVCNKKLSSIERSNIIKNSWLGSVIKQTNQFLSKPMSINLKNPIRSKAIKDNKDFPVSYLKPLIENTKYHRDKLIWLLMAGAGLRESEALNITWADIDHINQRVYVRDPKGLRRGLSESDIQRLQFKGREDSNTYWIEILKQSFFIELENYRKNEFIISNHDFVFIILNGKNRGKPYNQVNRKVRLQTFTRACKRAMPPPKNSSKGTHWTPHSLRHLYGVFMLNYHPTPSGYGFDLHEVQIMMGHKDIKSTLIYAIRDKHILEQKLKNCDMSIMGDTLRI